MTEIAQPQIYLITPPEIELSSFSEKLAGLLDAHAVACVRLSLASQNEDVIARTADTLREICHARDVPLVMDHHVKLVTHLGLDGVHLGSNAKDIRAARKDLGADAIVGCYCGNSRHDGITAGEIGADYVSFGPVRETGLGTGEPADDGLFEWWSEMVEVPVIAEGALTYERAEELASVVDFIALGSELWEHQDGAHAALDSFIQRLS